MRFTATLCAFLESCNQSHTYIIIQALASRHDNLVGARVIGQGNVNPKIIKNKSQFHLGQSLVVWWSLHLLLQLLENVMIELL